MDVTRPQFENAFEGMLKFGKNAKNMCRKSNLRSSMYSRKREIQKSRELAEKIGVDLRIRKFV